MPRNMIEARTVIPGGESSPRTGLRAWSLPSRIGRAIPAGVRRMLPIRAHGRVSALAISLTLHASAIALFGFVTWSRPTDQPRGPEYAVQIVSERRERSSAGGALPSEKSLADLARLAVSAMNSPAKEATRRVAEPSLAQISNTSLEPAQSGIPRDAAADIGRRGTRGSGAGAGLTGRGDTGSGVGNGDGLGDRERAGGSAVGGLWGVGGGREASSFVYVLDRSGSMQDTFYLLQDELVRAIGSLEPWQRFNVIWFSEGPVEQLSPTLLVATEANKRLAFDAVRRIVPGGRTEPLDAIQRGFRLQADVMFLLSDGDFEAQNRRVLQLVRQARSRRAVTINTILFVYDTGGQGEMILRSIAEATGGQYKHVTEDDLGG